MDSLFLDQLDPNEVPPRPPQRGAKLYYANDGTLKIRKFGETETISGNAFPSDWTQITSGDEYVYSGVGETITVTQDKTNVTITNVGSGNLVLTDTDRSKYIIIEPGDIVKFDALWDVGGQFDLTVTNRKYLATSGNPKAYIRTSHGSVGQNYLMTEISGDGIYWNPTSYVWPPSYPHYVRDASVIKYGNTFVIAYTNAFNGTGSFGVATSQDLVNWTKVGDIDVPGVVGSPNNTWAPEWFIEDGRYYLTVRVSTEAGVNLGTPGMLWTECTNPGTWTTFTTAQSIGGVPTDFNDVAIIKRGDTYHIFCYDGGDIVTGTSFSPFSGYSTFTVLSTDWKTQIGATYVEGPICIHIKGDHYRLYFQKGDTDSCYYAESYDGMLTWSDTVNSLIGNVPDGANGNSAIANGFGHGTVLQLDIGDVQNATNTAINQVKTEIQSYENRREMFWIDNTRDFNTSTIGIATAVSGAGFSIANGGSAVGGIRAVVANLTAGYSTVRGLTPPATNFNGTGTSGDNAGSWDLPIKAFVDVDFESPFVSGNTFRFYFGSPDTYTNGVLANKGVGFHITGNQLTGVSHNGTTLTQTSATTVTNYRRWDRLSIYSDGTTVEYYYRGNLVGSLSSPGGLMGWPNGGLSVSYENNGTGAATAYTITRAGVMFLMP